MKCASCTAMLIRTIILPRLSCSFAGREANRAFAKRFLKKKNKRFNYHLERERKKPRACIHYYTSHTKVLSKTLFIYFQIEKGADFKYSEIRVR